MNVMGSKTPLERFWHFLWHEDSVASWVVSIALAFVVIKFIIFPILGLLLGTTFPVVAVVSDSMEHNVHFDEWWMIHEDHYLRYNITKNDFSEFPMRQGFNKGDIIVLFGTAPEKIERGHIIVFWGGKAYPIIHRVVAVDLDENGERYFQTKGDNNLGQIIEPPFLDERHVPVERSCSESDTGKCRVLLGKAVFRIPYLGWVKIGFVNLLQSLGLPIA